MIEIFNKSLCMSAIARGVHFSNVFFLHTSDNTLVLTRNFLNLYFPNSGVLVKKEYELQMSSHD